MTTKQKEKLVDNIILFEKLVRYLEHELHIINAVEKPILDQVHRSMLAINNYENGKRNK